MGNYILNSDLPSYFPEERLIELADGDSSELLAHGDNAAARALIDVQIAAAENFIDAHLDSRYTVPVSPATAMLKLCAAHITLYYLARRKPEFLQLFEDDYERAVTWLERVRDGKSDLAGTSGTDAAQTSEGSVEIAQGCLADEYR